MIITRNAVKLLMFTTVNPLGHFDTSSMTITAVIGLSSEQLFDSCLFIFLGSAQFQVHNVDIKSSHNYFISEEVL